MPRLTITLPKAVYNRLGSIAMQSNDSMSAIINHFIGVGMNSMDNTQPSKPKFANQAEQHCQQLIIQMNALIKNMSAEMLKFNQDDFDKLKQVAAVKYSELLAYPLE